jgi:2-C-methyl-D-erythritol 4-phosphate cytidylyltransferase
MSHAGATVLPSVAVAVPEPEIVWTVVVAGGTGARFGTRKQYELVGDARILDRSVAAAAHASAGVVVVVPADDVATEATALAPMMVGDVVAGGTTRSASVRAGLAAVPAAASIVCVHDAARPFASHALFERVIAAVHGGADGAVPGVPVTDTIKVIDGSSRVTDTPARDSLVAVQTPQAFRAEVLRRAHAGEAEGTDDAALVEASGGVVVVVPGEADNRKVTHPDDIVWARAKAAAS